MGTSTLKWRGTKKGRGKFLKYSELETLYKTKVSDWLIITKSDKVITFLDKSDKLF